jgi:hypothetical protein
MDASSKIFCRIINIVYILKRYTDKMKHGLSSVSFCSTYKTSLIPVLRVIVMIYVSRSVLLLINENGKLLPVSK